MPTVPRAERRVGSAPLPGIRRSAQQAGAGVGQAMAGFGQDIAQVGAQAMRMREEEIRKERARMLRTFEMTVTRQGNDIDAQLLNSPDKGLLHKVGLEPMNALPPALEAFDQQWDMIASQATDQDQKDIVAMLRSERRMRLQARATDHAYAQLDKYQAAQAQATLQSERNAAIANFNDIPRVNEALGRIDRLIQENGAALGLLSPTQREAYRQELRSQVHVGVIEQFLASEAYERAETYFEHAKDDIVAVDRNGNPLRAKVEDALQAGSLRKRSQQASDAILNSGGTLADQREKARQIQDAALRDEVMQRIEHEAVVRDREDREADENRLRSAYDIVDQTKSVSRIPPAVWAALDGSDRSALRSYAKSMAEGTGQAAIKTDYATLYSLITQASANPDEFARVNLLRYRNQLSNGDLEQLMRDQARARQGDKPSSDLYHSQATQNDIIDDALSSIGLDLTPTELKKDKQAQDRILQFRRAVREAVDRHEARTGQKASDPDVQAIVDQLLVSKQVGGGWFSRGQTQYRFETPEAGRVQIATVPPRDRVQIVDALRRRGITKPTEDQIQQLYRLKVAQEQGR